VLPVLGLIQRVILPGSRCCVALTTVSSYGAAREASRTPSAPFLAVFSSADGDGDHLAPIGTLATVTNLVKAGDRWLAEVRGVGRVRQQRMLREHPFRLARVEPWPDASEEAGTGASLAAAVRGAVTRLAAPRSCVLASVQSQLRAAAPWEVPGLVAPLLDQVRWTEWQRVLEADAVEDRLAFVLACLDAGRSFTADERRHAALRSS
jgi:Lon protease-like protein